MNNTEPDLPNVSIHEHSPSHGSMKGSNNSITNNSNVNGNTNVKNKLRRSTRQGKLPPKYSDYELN